LVLSPTGSINLGLIQREDLLLCSSYLPLGVPNWVVIYMPSSKFSGAVAREKEDFCKGSLSLPIFYFVIILFILFLLASFYQKYKKISSYFKLFFVSSLVFVPMSPEEMIFTFKQKSEESFK
jgi:hypothetical protein